MDVAIEKDVAIPMRDGVVLRADVYRPAAREPAPTLLQRLPYDKEVAPSRELVRAVQSGYAVVVQDTRGRYASEGEFQPFVHEAHDGEDTIAWVAAQPWSTGSVGMLGGSYFGATQWLAASQAPAALKAIAPAVTAADYHEGWTYRGGAFALGFVLSWCLRFLAHGELERRLARGAATPAELERLIDAIDANAQLYERVPLRDMPPLRELAPYYAEWLGRPTSDESWRSIAPRERYAQVLAPALNIGGWYDVFVAGTLENYVGMRARGGSAIARRPRLVVGPWSHAHFSGEFAERAYGMRADAETLDLTGLRLRWFDRHVKGLENGVDDERPVRLFVMGHDVWREEDDWPLPDTCFTRYHLRSDGRANGRSGDGWLSTEAPGDEPEDVYVYDPRDPVPTVGGASFLPGLFIAANAGPRDQRAVEDRHDVLCYTTPPLERELEVIGPIRLVLHVSCSTRDTDFTGKLVDVHPDGRAQILSDGILRARYRDSPSEPAPLEPGRVYELVLDLGATANVFGRGHRVRLEVSSSNFPAYDRNTNTGGTIAEESRADWLRAVNRVHHSARHPSHLILPVIDRR